MNNIPNVEMPNENVADKNVSDKNEPDSFSLIKRAQSFTHASRGIWIFFKTTHNAWIHITVFICVILLGLFFNISRIDWIILLIVSGLVFVTESINTAIEIDIDLTSPTYHPYARDTKDVAAGAVLISSIVAVIVGILVFWPYTAIYLLK